MDWSRPRPKEENWTRKSVAVNIETSFLWEGVSDLYHLSFGQASVILTGEAWLESLGDGNLILDVFSFPLRDFLLQASA